jgi:hypothetical protein
MMLLFAEGVTGMGERLAVLAIKFLAVGGGFLFGYLIGLLVARALNRWVFASKAPEALKKLCALVSGVLFAVLVAIVVFGEGGGGLFGSGKGAGDSNDPPSAKDKDKGKTEPPEVKEPPKKPPEKLKPPEPKPTPGDLRVSILSGTDVKDGRFYLVEGDAAPKSFDEFRDAIVARRKEAKAELTIVFRFQSEPLSENHPAVRRAVSWVNEAKLLNRFE